MLNEKILKALREQTESRQACLALADECPETDRKAAESRMAAADQAVVEAITAAESTPAIPDELAGRVSLSNYVRAAVETRSATGAEAEVLQEMGAPGNHIPLELFAPPAPELRTTTDIDTTTVPRDWLRRIFVETCADHLGVDFVSVPAGVANFPIITAGANPKQRGRKQNAADDSFTIAVNEAKPTRHAVQVTFSSEDALRLGGSLESNLRADMQAALTASIDNAIFLGATANPTTANITGLVADSDVVAKTITQTNKVLYAQWLPLFLSLVDGLHANSLDDLAIVSSVATNVLLGSTLAIANTTPDQIAAALHQNGIPMWKVKGGLEDSDTAAGDHGMIIARKRGLMGACSVPVWQSVELIRDHYTKAKSGR